MNGAFLKSNELKSSAITSENAPTVQTVMPQQLKNKCWKIDKSQLRDVNKWKECWRRGRAKSLRGQSSPFIPGKAESSSHLSGAKLHSRSVSSIRDRLVDRHSRMDSLPGSLSAWWISIRTQRGLQRRSNFQDSSFGPLIHTVIDSKFAASFQNMQNRSWTLMSVFTAILTVPRVAVMGK